MSRVLIVFGTTDGHTRKVANALGDTLRAEACTAEVVEVQDGRPEVRPEPYDAVLVAGSVRIGGYRRPLRRWVRTHAAALNGMPTAFLTVCLAVLERREAAQREIGTIRDRFLLRTGWQPTTTKFVAGALPYTRYGWLTRWVMRRIAAKAGGATDTSRDYEFTDWADLRAFARNFARVHGLVAPVPRAGDALVRPTG